MGLARALVDLGCRVVFVARKGDPDLAASLGVELRLAPVPRFPRKLQDYRFFRRVESRPVASGAIELSLARLRVKDAVICGGTHRGYLAHTRKIPGPFDWLQVWMETAAYRAARVIVSHSDLCTRELRERYGVPAQTIVTLYPPVDQRFEAKGGKESVAVLRRRLGLPLDRVVFLFPSMGHRRKGLQIIRRALEGLPEPVLLAVAGKPPGIRRGAAVQALGYIEDMAAAYRAADFTVLGSSYEPFGLVGPESVRCGTRLIFEQEIGCLEALAPEAAFTFSTQDPDSLRQALSEAVAMARLGLHRLEDPKRFFRYDASPKAHARALLASLGEPVEIAAEGVFGVELSRPVVVDRPG